MHIEIDRIQISLFGVSAQIAEAAAEGLESELRRRLGVFPPNDLAAFDAGELVLGSIEAPATLDAAALRGIIAERISEVIRHRMVQSMQNSSPAATTQGGM